MEVTTWCGCREVWKMICTFFLPQSRSAMPMKFLADVQLANFQLSYTISCTESVYSMRKFSFLDAKNLTTFFSIKSFNHWWLLLNNCLIHVLVPNLGFFFLGAKQPQTIYEYIWLHPKPCMDSLVLVPAPTQGRFHHGEKGRWRFKLRFWLELRLLHKCPQRPRKMQSIIWGNSNKWCWKNYHISTFTIRLIHFHKHFQNKVNNRL